MVFVNIVTEYFVFFRRFFFKFLKDWVVYIGVEYLFFWRRIFFKLSKDRCFYVVGFGYVRWLGIFGNKM